MEPNIAGASRHANFATSAGGLAVYPLWRGAVADALHQIDGIRPRLERKLAVAAVLPDQKLELNDLDALEAAGVLVVEVPQNVRTFREEELAAFIEREIDGEGAHTVSASLEAPALVEARTDGMSERVASERSEDEDEALLQSINDPDADEGSI